MTLSRVVLSGNSSLIAIDFYCIETVFEQKIYNAK